jgi:hypothetical protein
MEAVPRSDEPPDDIELTLRRATHLLCPYVVETLRGQGAVLIAYAIQVLPVGILDGLPDVVVRPSPVDAVNEVLPERGRRPRRLPRPLKELPLVPFVIVPHRGMV